MSDSPPAGLALWLAGARLRTLPAAVVPVAVGTAAAVGEDPGGLIWWRAVAAMVVSLALQVGVNFANDYSDGVRGTDDRRRVGPLRLVGSGLVAPAQVKRAATTSFAVAGVIGFVLAASAGWELLVVGALALVAAITYTGGPNPYGYLGLGEAFVFVFFGVVATAGTTYVLLERLTGLALVMSVPVGLWATALLVINNLRDIPGDTAVGKRTLAVRLGDVRTRRLYVLMMVAAFVVAAVGGGPDRWTWMVLVVAPLAVAPIRTVMTGARGPALIAVLAATGQVQLLAGLALTAALSLSA